MDRQPACELIWRDEYLVAVNKPAGLLVHRSPIDRRETRFALQLVRDQLGRRVYPVHRLDKPTSGVLLFALSPDMARELAEQFAGRRVHKHYLAVVRGHCPQEGFIDHPLRDEYDPLAGRAASPAGAGDLAARSALTRYRRQAIVELPVAVDKYPRTRYSLVSLYPETGRRHQLRRHMKHIGHPIIGDAKHGKGVHNRFFQASYQCRRLLLACIGLELTHPASGLPLRLTAGLDAPFMRVVEAFGWQSAVTLASGPDGLAPWRLGFPAVQPV